MYSSGKALCSNSYLQTVTLIKKICISFLVITPHVGESPNLACFEMNVLKITSSKNKYHLRLEGAFSIK